MIIIYRYKLNSFYPRKVAAGFGYDFEVTSILSTEVTQYSRCGGLINVGEDVQKLASPAFPKYYPQNQNCKYMIRFDPESSNPDDLLYLKFLSFK